MINMSSLIERLDKRSKYIDEKERTVMDEIYDYFQSKFYSGEFEDALEDCLMRDSVLRERKYEVRIEFWNYVSGCSPTYFRCGPMLWRNPQNPEGTDSWNYHGVYLADISSKTVETLTDQLLHNLTSLGFKCQQRADKHEKTIYRNIITIEW